MLRPSPSILISPDSFKGTATAQQAAEWLGEGVRSIIRDAEITLLPMADGGEGTSSLFQGEQITLPTTDAAGLSLIHISEPTRRTERSRMPSSA